MPCKWGEDPRDGGPAIMVLDSVRRVCPRPSWRAREAFHAAAPVSRVLLCRWQIIIPAALDPEQIFAREGEDRLKERVQKVLAGIISKLQGGAK